MDSVIDFYLISQKLEERVEEYYYRNFEAVQDLVTLSKGTINDFTDTIFGLQIFLI